MSSELIEMVTQQTQLPSISEVIHQWPDDQPFDARAAMRVYPHLAVDHSTVVSLAYEEFCQRTESGEGLDPQSFARRFPEVDSSLLKTLAVHQYLETSVSCWPQAGERFLGFELQELLGTGAFSRVFLAREPKVGNRTVVVKLSAGGEAEADVLGRLNHKNIVPVFSVSHDDLTGLSAICMPFLGSTTLDGLIHRLFADGRIPGSGEDVVQLLSTGARLHHQPDPQRLEKLRRLSYLESVVHIGIQLCDALIFSHSLGIHHNDVKPSNVLLTSDGAAMLLDFNLSTREDVTSSVFGGTLPYMAPEQLRRIDHPAAHPKTLDGRTDLYSLAMVLYEFATGSRPYGDRTTSPTRHSVLNEIIRQKSQEIQELPEVLGKQASALHSLLKSCLAVHPEDRPASVADLKAELLRLVDIEPSHSRNARRMKMALAGGLAASLAAAALAAVVVPRHPFPTIEARADESSALIDQARALVQAANLPDAIRAFESAHELQPDGRAQAGLGYVKCLLAAEHPEHADALHTEALTHFQAAVDQGFANDLVEQNIMYCRLALMRSELERATTQRRLPDLSFVEAAVLAHPKSKEIRYFAALHYANAASQRPDSSSEYTSRGLRHCREAVQLGLAPKQLEKLALISAAWRLDPRFQSLLRSASPDAETMAVASVTDPLLPLGLETAAQ